MVRLAVEDKESHCQESTNDEYDPHIPSPACALRNETTADRTEDRAEKNACTVERYSFPSLRRHKHVGDDTGTDCQTCAASDTSEEAHADEATEVRCERASEGEAAEEEVGAVEYDVSSVDLGERTQEERAECEA